MADYSIPSSYSRTLPAGLRDVHRATHLERLIGNERRFFAESLPIVAHWAQADDPVQNGDPATPTQLFERAAIWVPRLTPSSPVELLVRAVMRDAETGVAGAGLRVTVDDGSSSAWTVLVNTTSGTTEEIEDSVWTASGLLVEGDPIMLTVEFGSTDNMTTGELYALFVRCVPWVAGDFP